MFTNSTNRRVFLKQSAATAGAIACSGALAFRAQAADDKQPLFKISLAEWSLHRTLFAGKLDNLDFAKTAKREFGIDAIEYVNQFFKDKAGDEVYLAELKKRAADEGVQTLLIMVDGEGNIGDPNEKQRTAAVDQHFKWVEAAKFLGCHSVRVNAASAGSFEEQQKLAVDGLRRLSEFAAKHDLNVLVENHGGLSSNGKWLAGVMKLVDMPNCGTLPDFGNFGSYDRYLGVKELMPFAKSVSAKSNEFDDAGNETQTDYRKMMRIVLDAGYHGYVGVEYGGNQLDEYAGTRATKKLLERIRAELSV